MRKRCLSILLALMLCLSLLPMAALAASGEAAQESTENAGDIAVFEGVRGEMPVAEASENETGLLALDGDRESVSGTCGGDLTWVLTPDGVLTISGTGIMQFYGSFLSPWDSYRDDIQTVVIEYGVTSIEDDAFNGCTSLESVEIPSSVTSIGDRAFDGCTSLESVEIPSSVTSIGYLAFSFCTSLESIEIPAGVTTIEWETFSFCRNLLNVSIPEGVKSIGYGAFSGCASLESIEIPASVTKLGDSLGKGMFFICTSLREIKVAEKNTAYKSVDGVLFSIDGTQLLCYPGGKKNKEYTIPDGVKSIDEYAFGYCSLLESVNIPDSVTSIGNSGFSNCSALESVRIPRNMTSIGRLAFRECSAIAMVTIPSALTNIEFGAFYGCVALKDVYYEGSEEYWAAVSVDNEENGNEPIMCAVKHYNSADYKEILNAESTRIYVGRSCAGQIIVKVSYGDVLLVEGVDYTYTAQVSGDGSISVSVAGMGDYGGASSVQRTDVPGDVDGDGEVTIMDVLALLKYVAGIGGSITGRDVNADGDVTIMDVLTLLKFVARIDGSVVY